MKPFVNESAENYLETYFNVETKSYRLSVL